MLELEVKKNIKEGSHQKSSTIKMGVCKQHIPCKKEGLGPKTSDKLKQLNACIPYCHFKMEGLQKLKYMLQEEDYMCKVAK